MTIRLVLFLLSGLQMTLASKVSLLKVSQNKNHLEGVEPEVLQVPELSR